MAAFRAALEASRAGGEPEGVQGGCPKLIIPAGACHRRDEHREK